MQTIAKKFTTVNGIDLLLLLLFLLLFRQGMTTVWVNFSSPEFYENGVAFLLVFCVFILTLFRKKSITNQTDPVLPFIAITSVLLLHLLNAVIFKFSIAPAILFLFGIYSLLGFYVEKQLWRRSVFIFIILILCLPLLERFQRFLGFPLRLITAEIVSFLLRITGIGTISQSAVIVTENHATSIDLPCSGVKSIYTGTLFMLAVYYLQKVRLSVRLMLVTLAFLLALILSNTWRVFSLVYIYDVLDMKQFGDAVHVVLGLLGFFLSCSLLWYLTKRYLPVFAEKTTATHPHSANTPFKKITVLILSLLLIVHGLFITELPQSLQVDQIEKPYALPGIELTELTFSDREKSYFMNSEVEYSKKFSGATPNGQTFSLLIVASKSARTHHDPEICLQGLGFTINNSQIRQTESLRLRQLSLNSNNDQVLYWYVGKDKNLLDYSERVWEEVTNPKQTWVLVVIGFTNQVDPTQPDTANLLQQINTQTKSLLE